MFINYNRYRGEGMFTIVTGAQFGDEGKGKIVDILSEDCDIIVRFQGGDNAGHTIVVGGEKFKLHILPSGILTDCRLLIGGGTVMNPEVLRGEISALEKRGISISPEKLGIDGKTSVIMPYHLLLDELGEAARRDKIGTTKRGIAYAYIDKVARDEIQVLDLVDESRLRRRLGEVLPLKKALIEALGGDAGWLFDEGWVERYLEVGRFLKPYVTDVSREVNSALDAGKRVLAEGAQGTFLDVLHGTQKYVTSSSTVAGSACANLGVGPGRVSEVLGVVKAYITRVGEGPLPTELAGETGDRLRERGGEYGTTTGRPRRCGWLDLPLLKKAVDLNGYTGLVLTKLDVLSGFDPVKVCHVYRLGGEALSYPPLDTGELAQCQPEYVEFEGWSEDISQIRSYDELPSQAKEYIRYIEEAVGVPVVYVSLGAGREQIVKRSSGV
jgi:adenylosuccinate synthase